MQALRAESRFVHVFELRPADEAPGAPPVELGAVRLDRHDGWREHASFVRRIRSSSGGARSLFLDEGVPLATALRAFLRFVGPDGPLLSWGDEGPRLEVDCRRAGLAGLLDRRRFADAVPLVRIGLGLDPAAHCGALPPLKTLGDAPARDSLHEARALARTLRWLHLRGRL